MYSPSHFDTATAEVALPPGTATPPVLLATDSGPLPLSDLRGQPVILAFSPPFWNPARSEQLAHFYNTLTEELAAPHERPDRLRSVGYDGIWCDLNFDGEPDAEPVRVPVLHDLDSRSDAARAFGVEGERALFLIGADGVIRWSYVLTPGAMPGPDLALSALRSLRPDTTPAQAPQSSPAWQTSRRDFVTAAFALALALAAPVAPADAAGAPPLVDPVNPSRRKEAKVTGTVPVSLQINGRKESLQIEPRVALLDALRENLGMTGTKKGCDHGQCGACTVHRDGERILSCLTLAVMCEGREITTIEGLANGDTLHPVQAAFIEHDGYQCGYCTPGQIMSAVALLKEGHYKTDAEIRDGMSGNLCRCGAYANIITSIKAARDA